MLEHRRDNRHPFQLWVLGAFLVGGVGVLLGPDPSSMDALVPDAIATAWAVILVLAAVGGLTAAVWPDPATSWLIERTALLPVGFAALAYSVAVWNVAGQRGLVSALLIAGVGIASLRRAWEVTRNLRRLRLIAPRAPEESGER